MSGSILNQFRVYSGDPVAPQSVPLHGQDFAASVRTQASAFRQEQSEAERCSSSSKQQSLLPVSELLITHVLQGNEQPTCQCQCFLCICVVMMTAIFLLVLCWTELWVLVVKSCMEGNIWVRITWQALCIKCIYMYNGICIKVRISSSG